MPISTLSRRSFTMTLATTPFGLIAAQSTIAPAEGLAGTGLSHNSELIRQEVLLDASPQRVYLALTTTEDFGRITRLSDGAALLDAAGAKPTAISTELGGAFTLFGGYITGRQLDMLPGERLVQAWRAGSWKAGSFSIAAFYLAAQNGKTRLSFEHRGFPDGNGASLAHGWRSHYWEPLAKFLKQG